MGRLMAITTTKDYTKKTQMADRPMDLLKKRPPAPLSATYKPGGLYVPYRHTLGVTPKFGIMQPPQNVPYAKVTRPWRQRK